MICLSVRGLGVVVVVYSTYEKKVRQKAPGRTVVIHHQPWTGRILGYCLSTTDGMKSDMENTMIIAIGIEVEFENGQSVG